MITIEDVIEEILGEVYDEHDDLDAERDFERFGKSWAVSGLVRIDELGERVGYIAPEGPYETLGGLVMALLGRIPKVNDQVLLPVSDSPHLAEFTSGYTGRWQAKVAAMEELRVDKVIMSPLTDEEVKELQGPSTVMPTGE